MPPKSAPMYGVMNWKGAVTVPVTVAPNAAEVEHWLTESEYAVETLLDATVTNPPRASLTAAAAQSFAPVEARRAASLAALVMVISA